MVEAIVAFWAGVAVTAAAFYLSTHPDQRGALFSRVKGLFGKKDQP